MTQPPAPTVRRTELDVLRILAILGVITIHVSSPIFLNDYGRGPQWLSATLWDSAARPSVPLFFMISGALVLDPARDPGQRWWPSTRKRLTRVLCPLLVWSLIYAWTQHVQRGDSFSAQLREAFQVPITYHFGFMYDIVCIYLLLPLMWIIHRGLLERRSVALYLFGFAFASQLIATFTELPLLQSVVAAPFVNYTLFFLLGAYLRFGGLRRRWWYGVLLLAVGASATFFLTLHASNAQRAPSEQYFVYLSAFVVCAAVGAFVAIPPFEASPRWSRLLATVSEATFFVYFVHVLVIRELHVIQHVRDFNVAISVPVFTLLVFAVALALSQLVRLIPKHKWIFG